MELKLGISFLSLLVILHFESSHGQWAAIVPPKISAVQGSCVVIPCSYTYPKRASKEILNRWIGFWKKKATIISTNLPKWKLPTKYRKRTLFLGNLQTHNCTMMLDGVRRTDTGPFYFRIELPQYGRSYSYTKNDVTIDVMSNPPVPSLSVQVRDKITASCSVSHSCPSYPPQFIWSHPGIVTLRSKKLNMWEWETVSTVTLKPLPIDFNKNLTCTVKYRGGKQARNSVSVYNQNITPIV
ncbi:sialic acid-binding Ig-like lectin 14 [Labrus bergylta]|uniref:sialic acid-binding Ig-like lectin 14 n=1 Tax=Labrus bergylta TaxID=56723 RepID=UPI003313608E